MKKANLQAAYEGSYYFLDGTGGDLSEWVEGYEEMLAEADIGKPKKWLQTTGKAINEFAGPTVSRKDQYQDDLVCLLFPLDGLDVGKLAIFKLQCGNRWFDDVINNMRASLGERNEKYKL